MPIHGGEKKQKINQNNRTDWHLLKKDGKPLFNLKIYPVIRLIQEFLLFLISGNNALYFVKYWIFNFTTPY